MKSKAEAIEWARRVLYEPGGHMDGEGEILLRQLFDIEDFGDNKAVDRHKKLGAKVAKRAKAAKRKTVYAGTKKAAKAKPAARAKKANKTMRTKKK